MMMTDENTAEKTEETSVDATPTTLQERLLAAMADIGWLEKGEQTSGGAKYKYMSEAQVKQACQKAFIKVGVMPTSIAIEVISDEWLKLGNGQQNNLVKVRATVSFGRGAEMCSYEGIGSSADKMDKAYMQAQTGAIREALKNAFTIPSGFDPEDDSVKSQVPDAPPQQGHQQAQRPSVGPPDLPYTKEQGDAIKALWEKLGWGKAAGADHCMEKMEKKPQFLMSGEAKVYLEFLGGLGNG